MLLYIGTSFFTKYTLVVDIFIVPKSTDKLNQSNVHADMKNFLCVRFSSSVEVKQVKGSNEVLLSYFSFFLSRPNHSEQEFQYNWCSSTSQWH